MDIFHLESYLFNKVLQTGLINKVFQWNIIQTYDLNRKASKEEEENRFHGPILKNATVSYGNQKMPLLFQIRLKESH